MSEVLEVIEENATQYLTFLLGGEEHAVDVLRVQEIRSYENATKMPHTPNYVRGIINLRGSVVPIIDLRAKFDLDAEFNFQTVTVLVKVFRAGKERTIGLVVDSVSEVYEILDEDMQPAPEMGGAISNDFVKSLATIDDRLVIILDIDSLINEGVLEQLDGVEVRD